VLGPNIENKCMCVCERERERGRWWETEGGRRWERETESVGVGKSES
jgi:hypothetical protein